MPIFDEMDLGLFTNNIFCYELIIVTNKLYSGHTEHTQEAITPLFGTPDSDLFEVHVY